VKGGRVAYDALGHDRRSLENATHRELIARCVLWAARREPSERNN